MVQSQHLPRIRELAADSTYTLQGIADSVGLSKQRVHQLVKKYGIYRQPATRCRFGHLWADHRYVSPSGQGYCKICQRGSKREYRERERLKRRG